MIHIRITIAQVAMRLDILGDADANGHGTHRDGTYCSYLSLTVTVTDLRRTTTTSCMMHGLDDFGLMQSDSDSDGIEGNTLWRANSFFLSTALRSGEK
jgi:hypothetical protein